MEYRISFHILLSSVCVSVLVSFLLLLLLRPFPRPSSPFPRNRARRSLGGVLTCGRWRNCPSWPWKNLEPPFQSHSSLRPPQRPHSRISCRDGWGPRSFCWVSFCTCDGSTTRLPPRWWWLRRSGLWSPTPCPRESRVGWSRCWSRTRSWTRRGSSPCDTLISKIPLRNFCLIWIWSRSYAYWCKYSIIRTDFIFKDRHFGASYFFEEDPTSDKGALSGEAEFVTALLQSTFLAQQRPERLQTK